VTDLLDVEAGATWRCIDFHLHTPGVHSFALPPGIDVHNAEDRQRLAEDYVEKLVNAGIDVAAITDYQGVRRVWFDLIRKRATAAGIVVLPGAELSIGPGAGGGVHLLLVSDPDTDPARISEVIRYQGTSVDPLFPDEVRAKHHDVSLRGSLPDALKSLRAQLGCVVIAAHALEKNGILKILGAEQTAELIRDGLIDGIDHCEGARERLRSTGLLTKEELDSLACTLSGDPKSLDELGAKTLSDGRRRLTWTKLSRVDASALRLALHDPQTRVLTRPPVPVRHARILAMEVEGGFLDGLQIRFSDDLTTLIGGRGAGKSAILETLRYGLGGKPFTDQSERMSLIRHALHSGGRVRLIVERPGPEQQRYAITRVLDQQPRVNDLRTGAALDVSPLDLFGSGASPVILLQREIQAVARDDGFRRRLLDEIIGDDARHADAAVRRTVEELQRNARAIEEFDRQLGKRDEYAERLNRLNVDIAFYEQQGIAEKLERHSRFGSDKARLDTAAQRVDQARRSYADSMAAASDSLSQAQSELLAAESEQALVLKTLAADIASADDRVKVAVARVDEELASLLRRVEESRERWPEFIAGLEEDLRRVQRELGPGTMDAKRYVDSVSERTALQPIVDGMARIEIQKRNMLADREELLRLLQDHRRLGFTLRQRAAGDVNRILDQKLRMNVTYLGDVREFDTGVTAVLRGSRVSADAISAVISAPGIDGVELMHAVRQGAEAVSSRFQITDAMARRLVNWLMDDPGRARQVEILAPEDHVAIALIVDGDQRDLAELSSGQKATALLLLLFAQGGRPLVLDQPEDDLDNRFVYEDVVALLRAEKGVSDPSRRRQIIVATHNANIPVNGDAELVLSLAAEGDRCQVRTRASIDDVAVRMEIRTVLEGGAEAFRRRAEKYGGLDDAR
jgi:chromosome segregation protein